MAASQDEKHNVIRIANCSGFYGDRLSAAREMVEGGPIDVLTGDYLAELTMAILHKKKLKDANSGFAGTFLKQIQEVLERCLENNTKIVSNAGGLNPKGMADAIEEIAHDLGLTVKVAYICGDDLMPRIEGLAIAGEKFTNIETGYSLADSGYNTVTANAYLGCWGIKEALDQGADVVICPRVTDAALVMGPAAWKFNWARDYFDALAGALTAGHIIECGTQATGGNYAFFKEVPSFVNVGFPLIEIEQDGSFTVTKHPGTGGLVSEGTVISQLLYEISSPAYLNPDVIAHFDSLTVEQVGFDRVHVGGCRGEKPPAHHKVCINLEGGYRNGIELFLTGLQIDAKAKIIGDILFDLIGGRDQFDEVIEQIVRSDKIDPKNNEEASAILRICVKSKNQDLVIRAFSAKLNELSLATIPGYAFRSVIAPVGQFFIHWPALIDSKHIVEQVCLEGAVTEVFPTSQLDIETTAYQGVSYQPTPVLDDETVEIPLGQIFGTRSGDKGGCANVGIWAKTDQAYDFLFNFLSVERLKKLLPDMEQFSIDRYELPNIRALNFYIHGVLGEGISASFRLDGQAKSLGEYLRAKYIDIPEKILEQNISIHQGAIE